MGELLLADVPEFAVAARSRLLKFRGVDRFAVGLGEVHGHQPRLIKRRPPGG